MPYDWFQFSNGGASGAFERSGPAGEDVFDFAQKFTLSASPIIQPSTGIGGEAQVQELYRCQINPATDRCFWSEWDNGTATPSRVRTALSLRATPTVFTNDQVVLESEAASTATSGALDYLRIGGVDYDGTTFRLNLNGGGDVFEATSTNGTAFSLNTSPVLGSGHHLLAMLRNGSDLFGISSLNGGTSSATYHVFKWVASAWDEISGGAILSCGASGTTDGGGMEFHFPFLYGGRVCMFYEGYSGASGSPANKWTAQCAYSGPIESGDVESALIGAWTKLGVVAEKDAHTSWAQVHIATPTYYDGRFYCQGSNIGDDFGEPVQGNPGVWEIGTGLLPA